MTTATRRRIGRKRRRETHRRSRRTWRTWRTRRTTSLYVNFRIYEYIYTNIFTLLQTENEFDASNSKKDKEEEERDGAGDQEDYMDPYGEDEGL